MSEEQNAASADMERVVARAIEDEDFRRRLGEDPEGTIRAEGYQLSAEEIEAVRHNVDPELTQEQLEDRVSKAALPMRTRVPGSGSSSGGYWVYGRGGSRTWVTPNSGQL